LNAGCDTNVKSADTFLGLVQPTDSERALNGWRLKKPRIINAEEQVASAWEAFSSEFFCSSTIGRSIPRRRICPEDAEVCFYKLVPLVGG
jgi:hypothetical protein